MNLENRDAYDYCNCIEILSEPWELIEVLSLDSPSLKFCFDTGQGNMTNNSEALLQELAPWLNYVHLADNGGEHNDYFMFRKGTVASDRDFQLMQDAGFDGGFCYRVSCRKNRQPFDKCVQKNSGSVESWMRQTIER